MVSDEYEESRVEVSPDEDEAVGVCVVRAVAALKGVDADDLSITLNEIVDPDALERIFAPRPNGAPRRGGELRFVLADCSVTVGPDRTVVVAPERRA
jgi:hypothetical protein